MASVDGISPVDVRADQIPFGLVLTEDIRLMSACVGSKDVVPVDVICVCPTSPGMVGWKPQRIEVLSDGDCRMEAVVRGKRGGRLKGFRTFETRFDDLAGEA